MSVITESILDSEKKLLGLDQDYDVFDDDLIIHINTIFGTLHQIGVGPSNQFFISDNTATWSEFTTNEAIVHEVRSYMFLRLRLLFDPPSSSFVLNSYKEQIQEFEWRLNVKSDEIKGTKADD